MTHPAAAIAGVPLGPETDKVMVGQESVTQLGLCLSVSEKSDKMFN